MRLVRYGEPGRERPGLLDAAGSVRDLSGVLPDIAGEALSTAALERLAGVNPAGLPAVADPGRLGPPLAGIGKIIGVGLNYRDHAEEQGTELPKAPLLFAKWQNTLIGDGDTIVIPPEVQQADYEAELGVVIGRTTSRVSETQALDAVRGYICVNDVSARDLQFADGQWSRGKSVDTFCPVGPRLVPREEVEDPQALGIRCHVNGETLQDSTTGNMIFSVAEIIAYVSRTITLEAGDLIATGTPAGVGVFRDPKVLLKDGDEVTVEIDGLGSLTNPVKQQGA
jgi:2-keto-4-pentenoate hydratase/2-oxohepta-3-ene-1,7-dioic acid hydratase in catechol pathway